jgi:WhiB family redox-sensing transcriptional regulator
LAYRRSPLAPEHDGAHWRPGSKRRARRSPWPEQLTAATQGPFPFSGHLPGGLELATGWSPPASHRPPARDEATWRDRAACRDLPTELFFPVGHGARAQAQAELAKALCRNCAVQADCLLFSLAANTEYGVFGGLAEDERRSLRRRLGLSHKSRQLEETA